MLPTPSPTAGSSRSAPEFLRGARDIAPIVLATMPFGVVFGAIASHEGMSIGDATLVSATTFAGASQFAALQSWAHPLPFLTIILSVTAVNLRLALYSAAIGRRMEHWPAPLRYAGLGMLSDPIVALAELRGGPRLGAAYYFGLSMPLYASWIVTTAAGAVFGSLITAPEVVGLDFVVTAYFIHLLLGFRQRNNALALVLASAVGSVVAWQAFGPPWHFAGGAFSGLLAAVLLAGPRRAPA